MDLPEPISKAVVENIDKIEQSQTYQAGLCGAVTETGKALTTVGQAVNAALLPVQGLIWGANQIADWLNARIAEKMEQVPPEKIQQPNPHVAGPAIDALRFTAQESELREMFAELLANSINADTSADVHPCFVDLIKSMNTLDAKLLKELASRSVVALIDIGVKNKDSKGVTNLARNVSLLGVYAGFKEPGRSRIVLENLERMGLCTVVKYRHLANEKLYEDIKAHPDVQKVIADSIKEEGAAIKIDKGAVEITSFGRQFVKVCMA